VRLAVLAFSPDDTLKLAVLASSWQHERLALLAFVID
jgi:hypothetical protein